MCHAVLLFPEHHCSTSPLIKPGASSNWLLSLLLGLEAVTHTSIQETTHETLTLGHSAQEAAYSAILWDNISKEECEATICQLHSEGDAAWREVRENMFNHQLEYDRCSPLSSLMGR